MDIYSVLQCFDTWHEKKKREKKKEKKVSTTKHRDILLIGFHRSRIIVLTFPLFVVAESGTREASTPSKAGGGDKRKRGEKFGAAGWRGDAEESIGGAEWAREAGGTGSGEPGRRAHSAKHEACRSAERGREAGRAAAHRGQGAEGKVCPPKYHAPGSRQQLGGSQGRGKLIVSLAAWLQADPLLRNRPVSLPFSAIHYATTLPATLTCIRVERLIIPSPNLVCLLFSLSLSLSFPPPKIVNESSWINNYSGKRAARFTVPIMVNGYCSPVVIKERYEYVWFSRLSMNRVRLILVIRSWEVDRDAYNVYNNVTLGDRLNFPRPSLLRALSSPLTNSSFRKCPSLANCKTVYLVTVPASSIHVDRYRS